MQGSRLLPHYKPRQGSGGWEKEVVGESPGLAGGCGLRANASHPVGATAIGSPSNGDAKASQSSQRLPAKRLPAEKLSATKRPFCRPLPAAAASAMSCNMSRCRSAQIEAWSRIQDRGSEFRTRDSGYSILIFRVLWKSES